MITCTVFDERAELFLGIFGTDTVPIESPISKIGNLPGIGQQEIYKLDLTKIDSEQRARLVNYLAVRFNVPAQEIEHDLNTLGMPILTKDTLVGIPLSTTIDVLVSDEEVMYWDWKQLIDDEIDTGDLNKE